MPSAADTPDTRLGFAFALAGLAGAVDAIAVLSLGDVFVSFMSGNTTLLGNALVHVEGRHALQLAGVLVAFVIGVFGGELLAVRVAPRRRSSAVLAAVCAGLAIAATLAWRGAPQPAIALCLAAAMGMQNATVRRAGGMDVALTYVTGTLVRLGRVAAGATLGRARWRDAAPIAGLWLAFVSGAAAGGLAATTDSIAAIGVAAVAAATLAVYAGLRSPIATSPPFTRSPS